MPAVTLKAHFDRERILLDEPFELPLNASLMITVLPPAVDLDSDPWSQAAAVELARAYSDDEPDYSLDDIKS